MSKSANDFEYYERNGKRYDRISTILDYFSTPELVDWKVRVGKREAGRISREALKIGTNVDEAIRAEVNRTMPVKLKTDDAMSCWSAFQRWRTERDVGELRTVGTVYCDDLMVAGTPDLFWPKEVTLIDVKCAATIKPSYWLQTEFYARVLNLPTKGVLRLHKGLGIYEFRQLPLSDEHWAVVCGLVKAYRYYKPRIEAGNEVNNDTDSAIDSSADAA